MRLAMLSAAGLLSTALSAAPPPLMLQRPALSQTHIVFNFAGDLWIVPRAGGDALRLTAAPGVETDPVFSPDGRLVAFAGTYEGNMDIYTVPAAGGVPKRLTHHPSADVPLAFTPDGKKILFRSQRKHPRMAEFFLMGLDPGPAEDVPLPYGFQAVFSPDGARVAYTPLAPAFTVWKRYRGGRTSKIWLANLSDSKVEEIPRDNSNDFCPMWAGDRIYFLSDRGGPMNLHAFDLKTRRVTEAARSEGFEYKSASLGPGAIVLERFGRIELFDLKSGRTAPVNIRLAGDLAGVRPYFDRAGQRISWASLSPTGVRAVFEARGDILTVPAEKGDVRNLTATSGAAERFPDWSPDGTSIAYLSDESGEYQLHVRNQNGLSPPEKYDLGSKAFFYRPKWSPDGKKILFRDSNLNLAWIDIASRKVTRIDTDYYDTPDRDDINPSWSPDSKWIVYTKLLPNRLRTVYVYSLDSGKASQVSDGLSDARHAAFDKDGRHLYFTASTNTALSTGWLDMSSVDRITSRSVYTAVLRKEDPSPLAPESDEEKPPPAKKEETKPGEKKDEAKDKEVRIDFDGINQRILALPIPARNFVHLEAGKTGMVFLLERPAGGSRVTPGPPGGTLHKFELKNRKFDRVLDGVRAFTLSHDGEKMLLAQPERWIVTAAGSPPRPNEGVLKTDQMEVRVDPVAEWRQMYREVWRIQRDFLYDPGAHGLDLAAAEKRYEPFLAGAAHRGDLNYLFGEMLGNLVLGHTNVFGGATADPPRNVSTGLLGADYKIENGRYRFARVFDGENWNPDLRAPLTQPGVNVRAGDYLLAVNGRDVRSTDDVYAFFGGLADKQVVLRTGPNPDGAGARDVTVVPVANENNLRYMAWVEDNRRQVERLSGGRLGYVHLPNTSIQGYTHFNRWYFGQVGKEGFVLDERFNGGGFIADYIIDYLRRPLLNFFTTRAGHDFTTPMNAVFGPKVMIVNEYAGSGGDAMPWMFRKLKIGTLAGKRTWGGLVGIFGFPQLIDGGGVTAPNLAFYNTEKQWDVENHGVAPDVEVDYDPAIVRQGRDPQLERSVEILLDSLKKNPLPKHERPAYPNYYRQ